MQTKWQDPATSEILSSHISGLQEAVGKIEDVLQFVTQAEAGIVLNEVVVADDRYRIYQAQIGKRNWLETPAPVIKKNGIQITEGFTIDYAGGAVIFDTNLVSSDLVVADATYTTNVSGKLEEVFQSGVDCKISWETEVTAKGGTVSKIGTIATVNELIAGTQSIPTPTGDAVESDVLLGKGFSNSFGVGKVGTLLDKTGSATIITPSTIEQVIPKGYYDGTSESGKIVGDANLTGANIKSGKSIFGVAGNVEEKFSHGIDFTAISSGNYDPVIHLKGVGLWCRDISTTMIAVLLDENTGAEIRRIDFNSNGYIFCGASRDGLELFWRTDASQFIITNDTGSVSRTIFLDSSYVVTSGSSVVKTSTRYFIATTNNRVYVYDFSYVRIGYKTTQGYLNCLIGDVNGVFALCPSNNMLMSTFVKNDATGVTTPFRGSGMYNQAFKI